MALDFFNDPLAMARAATNFEVGGHLIGALGHITYARQAKQAGAYQAQQLRENAGLALASGQRDAESVDVRAKLIASRALAVAAGGGGGASDPTVVNTIAGIASEGAYRKALALYHGETEARGLNMRADAATFEGESQAHAARTAAAGSLISAGSAKVKGRANELRLATSLAGGMGAESSLRQKYGGSGPKFDTDNADSWVDEFGFPRTNY